MNTERRQISAAPGHVIDRAGQVFRVANGQAVRVPANDRGVVRLRSGNGVITADRRTLLGIAFPEATEAEMREEPAKAEPVAVAPEPEPKPAPKPSKRGRGRSRTSSDDS